jgi:hypothetical protein
MISVFAVSFLTSMACTLVSMNIVPQNYSNPLFQKLIPDLLSGHIINLGQLCGLSGYWSLVPLVLLWAVGARHIARLIAIAQFAIKTCTKNALRPRTKTLMPLLLARICYSMIF